MNRFDGKIRNRILKRRSNMAQPETLVVLWTSGDRDIAFKMVFMYTLNSKLRGWWKDVTIIVWGPSAELLSYDSELQEHVVRMKKEGINFEACVSCSDQYGVSEELRKLGIDVKGMGSVFTDYLTSKKHKVITL